MIAEAAFEKMLPAYFVLGVDKNSEEGFLVVGIHLKMLVGGDSLDALNQNESEVKLGVVDGQSLSKSPRKLAVLEGPSNRVASNMPVCFCEMYAGRAFVVCCSFDPVHVSASWKKIVGKFDDEDLGAVLQSVKGFSW